jgi:hypothetical protein
MNQTTSQTQKGKQNLEHSCCCCRKVQRKLPKPRASEFYASVIGRVIVKFVIEDRRGLEWIECKFACCIELNAFKTLLRLT